MIKSCWPSARQIQRQTQVAMPQGIWFIGFKEFPRQSRNNFVR